MMWRDPHRSLTAGIIGVLQMFNGSDCTSKAEAWGNFGVIP